MAHWTAHKVMYGKALGFEISANFFAFASRTRLILDSTPFVFIKIEDTAPRFPQASFLGPLLFQQSSFSVDLDQ